MMEAWEMFENLRTRCEELFYEKLILKAENRALLEQIAKMKKVEGATNDERTDS